MPRNRKKNPTKQPCCQMKTGDVNQLMKILTTSRKGKRSKTLQHILIPGNSKTTVFLQNPSVVMELPPVWQTPPQVPSFLVSWGRSLTARMPLHAARIPGVGGSSGWPLSLSFSERWRFSRHKACPAFEEKLQICKTQTCLLWFLAKTYKTRQQGILLHSPNAYQRRNVTAAEVLKRRCRVFPK